MIKRNLIAALLTACCLHCFAQKDTSMFSQYIGVQVNQLIKQVVNLNSSTTNTINDPYLLIYSINLSKTGWGLQAGIGYNYQDIKNTTPPANESVLNDLSFRIGLGRRVRIGKRFEAGFGLDYVGEFHNDKTITAPVITTNTGTSLKDSTASSVNSKTSGKGFGAELNLSFYLTKRVLLGTEASLYYMVSKQKQNVYETDTNTDFNGISTTTSSNSNNETDTNTFSITLPVSLFIIVKF